VTLPFFLALFAGGYLWAQWHRKREGEKGSQLYQAFLDSQNPLRVPLMVLGDHLARLATLNRISNLVYPSAFRWLLAVVGLCVGFNVQGTGASCSTWWGWPETYGLTVGLIFAFLLLALLADRHFHGPDGVRFVLWSWWELLDVLWQFSTQVSWHGLAYGYRTSSSSAFLWPEPSREWKSGAYWVGLGIFIIAVDMLHALFRPALVWKFGSVPQLMSADAERTLDGEIHLRKATRNYDNRGDRDSQKLEEQHDVEPTLVAGASGKLPGLRKKELKEGQQEEQEEGEGGKAKGGAMHLGRRKKRISVEGGGEHKEGEEGHQKSHHPHPEQAAAAAAVTSKEPSLSQGWFATLYHSFLTFLSSTYTLIARYVFRVNNERGHFGHWPIVFAPVGTLSSLDLTGQRLNEGRRIISILRGVSIYLQSKGALSAPIWLVVLSAVELGGLGFVWRLLFSTGQLFVFAPLLLVSAINHVIGLYCTNNNNSASYSCSSSIPLGAFLVLLNLFLFLWVAWWPLKAWWPIFKDACKLRRKQPQGDPVLTPTNTEEPPGFKPHSALAKAKIGVYTFLSGIFTSLQRLFCASKGKSPPPHEGGDSALDKVTIVEDTHDRPRQTSPKHILHRHHPNNSNPSALHPPPFHAHQDNDSGLPNSVEPVFAPAAKLHIRRFRIQGDDEEGMEK